MWTKVPGPVRNKMVWGGGTPYEENAGFQPNDFTGTMDIYGPNDKYIELPQVKIDFEYMDPADTKMSVPEPSEIGNITYIIPVASGYAHPPRHHTHFPDRRSKNNSRILELGNSTAQKKKVVGG